LAAGRFPIRCENDSPTDVSIADFGQLILHGFHSKRMFQAPSMTGKSRKGDQPDDRYVSRSYPEPRTSDL
jgi:hypothetical protein